MRSFHSLHAISQPLQPIQLEISTNFAYSGVDLKAVGCCAVADAVADILLIASVSVIDLKNHAFEIFTRNALNSGHRVFASPMNGVN